MYNLVVVLRAFAYLLNVLLIAAIAVTAFAYVRKSDLPNSGQIDERLRNEPRQESVNARPSDFFYEAQEYVVQPRAMYSIRGLVVSHNDIEAFDDIYHDHRSVDLRDFCIVWGDNLSHNLHQQVEYWSEPWSCHYRPSDRQTHESFRGDQLSNNHLLSRSESVRSKIRAVQIGDQIELVGELIDYFPVGASEQLRKTSLVRDDTGNGACEVLMVRELNLITPSPAPWGRIYGLSSRVLWASLVLRVLCFLALPYFELHYRKRPS